MLGESLLERAALEWFEELGYEAACGPDISPGGSKPERDSYSQVLLLNRLRQALLRINPTLPEEAIEKAISELTFCSICFNVTSSDPCPICSDPSRDRSIICVVEQPNDLYAIEDTGSYKGLYHVLGGVISPLSGVSPEDLHIKELVNRLKNGEVKEVIIATNPDAEGDATAIYLAKLLSPIGIKVTRIARGLPTGGDLEFSDPTTLGKAIEGRREEF